MKLFQKPVCLVRSAYLGAHSRLLGGAYTCGPVGAQVALTFDDGPSESWTPEILEIMEKHGAPATFFMIGEHVARFPDMAREVVARGHEPGLHLFTHERAVADNDEFFRRQVVESVEQIEKATGARPRFLRFPFAYLGRQKPERILAEFGLHTVHWSFSSMDSRRDAAGIVRRVRRFLFPGAIVLLHDGVGGHSAHAKSRVETVRALPAVLDACTEMRLTPVSMSRMFSVGLKE